MRELCEEYSPLLLILLLLHTITLSLSHPLDPKQVKALQSLNINTRRDPCLSFLCDTSTPFRHLTTLHLSNCTFHHYISSTALKSLSTLSTLHLFNCPIKLSFLLSHMPHLQTLIISHSNLTSSLPKHIHSPNLTYIDLSFNNLRGNIPSSITMLDSLQVLNLSSNGLKGQIPSSIGNLISLQNLSLSFNSFSGDVPLSFSAIPGLVHLDLSSNHLNGTIPTFISEMRNLKHLNLADNLLHGVLPFNPTFIERLEVLKLGGNGNLCYNSSVLSSKLKLQIPPCDSFGRPITPPPSKHSNSANGSSDQDYDYDYDYDDTVVHKKDNHHGPNKVVLGLAIALSSLVFLVVFLILCSKCCR